MDLIAMLTALAAFLNSDRLAELAARLGAADDDPAGPITDGELDELRSILAEATNTLLDADATDDVLGHLNAVRDGLARVTEIETDRATAAAERAAARQAVLDDINGLLDDGTPADDGEPAAEPVAEETAPAAAEETAPVPVAASATPPAPAPVVSRVAARRPAAAAPIAPAVRRAPIVAAGSYAGLEPGHELDGVAIGRVMEQAVLSGQGYRGPNVLARVLRLGEGAGAFPEDRFLTDDPRRNTRLVEAVRRPAALAAAGGIVAPVAYSYDLPTVGTVARPIRDALARFGAEARGVVGTMPPPMLGDADNAVTVWTESNDRAAEPGGDSPSPATKACLRITAPELEETYVDAIVTCLEFGNFGLRYFREHADAWMELAAVETARIAENRLLTTIAAGSVDVTIGQTLGTTRDILAGLDRAWSAYTWRHRAPDLRFRFIAPIWLYRNMCADIARQIPVGTLEETFAVAAATIESFFANRNTTVTWHYDGLAGQGFDVQADGALEPWPSTVETFFFPEGDWLFVDGGELNLGLVRDSTLNSTNDAQMFTEIFEAAHHHGTESWRMVFDVEPIGTYSAPESLTLISGS